MKVTIGELRQLISEILHDKANFVVYHASPQLSLNRILPRRSPKFPKEGVFVSSSKESMFDSWISWALRKPDATRTGRTSELYDKIALYTIRIPRALFDEAEKYHAAAAESSSGETGAWGWDVETFIPASLIEKHTGKDYLEPTSREVFDRQDFEKTDRSKQGWKKAGSRPEEPDEIPLTGKNPARAILRDMEDKIETSALKRGGPLGTPTGWRGKSSTPNEDIWKAMNRLRDLAKKTRLDSAEKREVDDLEAEIDELLSIQVKRISQGPPRDNLPSSPSPRSRARQHRASGVERHFRDEDD